MQNKKIYTKKLGSLVARGAHSSLARYHVIANESSKWSVVTEGSTKALKIFETKQKAIDFATTFAVNKKGEVIIHTEFGQVAERMAF